MGETVLSAGGSHYFDRVVEIFRDARLRGPTCVVLRSGGYVTADHRTYLSVRQVRRMVRRFSGPRSNCGVRS